MTRNRLRALAALAAVVAIVLVAVPVLGVDPSVSPSASADASAATPSSAASATAEPSAKPSSQPPAAAPASAEPKASASPEGTAQPAAPAEPGDGDDQGDHGKPDKAAKDQKEHVPEHPVTLTGIVGKASGEDGDYTLVVGLKVYQLSAGPKWWWGDSNPLAASVGKTVTIDGEQEEGSTEVDVLKVNGKAIREPGKPPWAGGWKVVGPKHPGWAQWKVDKLAGKGHGRDTAPGQLKKADAAATPAP